MKTLLTIMVLLVSQLALADDFDSQMQAIRDYAEQNRIETQMLQQQAEIQRQQAQQEQMRAQQQIQQDQLYDQAPRMNRERRGY
jgi:hypothetical protein